MKMHQIFPKVNQVFSYHLSNFEVIQSLMSSISLRVEAEHQYEKAISKSAQKISDLKSEHPLYSKIIKSFKSLISERVSQVRFFKEQIANEAEQLKQALLPIEQQMKTSLSELKAMQKDLKSSFDNLLKNKGASESKLKQLDQKFILNQISVLYKQNIGLRKHSEAYLSEQKKMTKSLEKDLKAVRQGMAKFEVGAREKEKVIWELDFRVEEQFVDFIKKYNVHQISLIRNIQYDIDTMIKKTDIFNWQKTEAFEEQFSGHAIEQFEMSFKDPYKKFKKAIVGQESIVDDKAQIQCDQQKLKQISSRLSQKEERAGVLHEIEKQYSKSRDEVCVWIESFRKQGKFKFEVEQFQWMTDIFKELLRSAIKHQDFECIQKIIQYGNSYCTTIGEGSKKRTILDQLKKENILSDLSFWRYYLLWLIRESVHDCKATEDRQIHIRNAVYTTLLSSSLSMIDWGIDKYSVKNCVGKMAKTFGSLTQAQIAELLRLTEAAYQNHEKVRKNRKE